MTDGARVDVDEYEKDSASDFALWKAPKPGRSVVGHSHWTRPPRLAHRVLSHVDGGTRRELRLARRRRRPDLSPSRKRNRAIGIVDRKDSSRDYWFHVRFLLVEGEKMSKSLGNFFTVRDLVLRGHKPSSIRYLLTPVPYRNQLNFTFDGLKSAAGSVERLRNFRLRLTCGKFLRRREARDAVNWRAKPSNKCGLRSTTISILHKRRPRSSKWCAQRTPPSTAAE